MNAAIVTIGDEILIGQVTDTNSVWISRQFTSLGLHIYEMVSISDTPEQIILTLDRLIGKVDLVLMTGGLGPTRDDLTKEVLAGYFGGKLVVNSEVRATIETFFKKRGRTMIESNIQQAEVPDNCRVLPNNHGTAPGMWFEKGGTHVVSMPGVPYEMKPMVLEQVIPALEKEMDIPVLVHRTIMTHSVPESYLAEMIREWEDNLPDCVKLAYLPRPGIVRLRLTVVGSCAENGQQMISGLIASLQEKIDKHIFAFDDILLEQVLGEVLKEKGLMLSTAESCTGGNIARLITSVPGSSGYFKGSMIAYSNEIKQQGLSVDPGILEEEGAVSKAVVESMATGALRLFGSDVSIAVSGIAGPDGGTREKPVGLVWIAVADKARTYSKEYRFGGNRELIIEQASIMGIGLLYKLLQGKLPVPNR
ncbi:MAG: competence/damage-inducible protein A [Bacteroidales bacterium]